MKLIRCHIENYGKLQQFDYDFTDNLNIILQENGWGKSTFASFIKAMLFGLPQTTKQDLDENERKKYTPWQGGNFGGWLEFELKDKQYRIERFFGEKQSKDKFALYDLKTNIQINEPEFVQKQLGINANTFMRSTFIQHNFISPTDDESIKEKLGKLIENQDLESLAEVDKKLLTYQTSLELLRGKGGQIYQKQLELEETIEKLENCKSAKIEETQLNAEFKDNTLKLQNIQQQIDFLRKKLQAVNDERTKEVIRKQLAEKQREFERIDAERKSLLDFFKQDPPTLELIENLAEYQNRLEKYKSTLEELNENREAINYEKLKTYFINGVPTENDLNEAKQLTQKISNIDTKIQISQNVFNQSNTSKNNKNKIFSLGFGALALILIIIGFAGFLNNIALLITFIGLGAILGIISIIFAVKPTKNDNLPANIISKNNIENLTKEQENYKLQVLNFINKYNENTQDLQQAILNISFNLKQFKEYKDNQDNLANRKQEYEKKIQEIKSKLSQYYSQFFVNYDHFNSCLTECRSKFERLKYITQTVEQKRKDLQNFIEENKLNEEDKNVFQNLDLTPIEQQIDTLEAQKDNLTKTNSAINSRLINLSNLTGNLSGLQATVESLKEEISKLKENLITVKYTRDFLNSAKNNLTAKYLTPLSNAFKEYSRKIVGEKFDKVSIDTSLNVLIEQHGEKKTSKFYSSGGKDVIELCMRLALARTLFENETPPLIMDDPFNNLDDEKTQKGLAMLEEISKEFQVIYLVCHSSRAIKK